SMENRFSLVDALPRTQRHRRSHERLEALTAPELVVVNRVTTFHLAVLFPAGCSDGGCRGAAARTNVNGNSAPGPVRVLLTGNRDVRVTWETRSIVDRTWKLAKSEAPVVGCSRPVLCTGTPESLHLNEVDGDGVLNRFAGCRFLEQLQLPGLTSAFGPLRPW